MTKITSENEEYSATMREYAAYWKATAEMLKNENYNLQISLAVSKAEKDSLVEQIKELKNTSHKVGLASKDEMLKVLKDQSKSHRDTIANLENVRTTSNKARISIDSAKQK